MNWSGREAGLPLPPRFVPRGFYRRRMLTMFVLGIVFTAVGGAELVGLPLAFCYASGWTCPIDDLRLNRDHETTTAVLVDKELMTNTRVNSEHPWRVDYRFDTAAGDSVDGVGFTYDQSIATRPAGAFLDVEYDPAKPTRSRPRGGMVTTMPLWRYGVFLAIGLPMFGLGFWLLIAPRWRAGRERELSTHGTATRAAVQAVTAVTCINVGRNHPYDIEYRFTDTLGREVLGRDRTYHYAWAAAQQPGQDVVVIYNPADPQENALWLHGSDAPLDSAFEPADYQQGRF